MTSALAFLRVSSIAPAKYAKLVADAGIYCVKRATLAALGTRRSKWLGVDL